MIRALASFGEGPGEVADVVGVVRDPGLGFGVLERLHRIGLLPEGLGPLVESRFEKGGNSIEEHKVHTGDATQQSLSQASALTSAQSVQHRAPCPQRARFPELVSVQDDRITEGGGSVVACSSRDIRGLGVEKRPFFWPFGVRARPGPPLPAWGRLGLGRKSACKILAGNPPLDSERGVKGDAVGVTTRERRGTTGQRGERLSRVDGGRVRAARSPLSKHVFVEGISVATQQH